eukprot:TRINITY_DN1917_c1_g1_i2.p1 TRINITY_DN1917_c1_g1~~TRINITY_DN1917_c1_g1_i2.p1  ORF type:complete len:161 (-),score=53.38 TRINITY_DN1917_c1_g1_i2:535-981(-)
MSATTTENPTPVDLKQPVDAENNDENLSQNDMETVTENTKPTKESKPELVVQDTKEGTNAETENPSEEEGVEEAKETEGQDETKDEEGEAPKEDKMETETKEPEKVDVETVTKVARREVAKRSPKTMMKRKQMKPLPLQQKRANLPRK